MRYKIARNVRCYIHRTYARAWWPVKLLGARDAFGVLEYVDCLVFWLRVVVEGCAYRLDVARILTARRGVWCEVVV